MQPFVDSILHPTDFSPASEVAFAHALAIALYRRGTLTLLHASKDLSDAEWEKFPSVRGTLERWGLLAPGSSQADVYRQLHVKVKKVEIERGAPVSAILDYLEERPNDLLVLASEPQAGAPAFLEGSDARKLARRAQLRTLFVPAGVRGFVSPADGTLSLRRIVVPVAAAPDPLPALETAERVADALGVHPVEIQALHVGDAPPALALEDAPAWRWSRGQRRGDPVDQILAAAHELPADLIVMTSDGPDVLLDVFRGSHADRVVRAAPCPVVVIPAETA
jgi:nucleotide-binding universal stress UspA family protein